MTESKLDLTPQTSLTWPGTGLLGSYAESIPFRFNGLLGSSGRRWIFRISPPLRATGEIGFGISYFGNNYFPRPEILLRDNSQLVDRSTDKFSPPWELIVFLPETGKRPRISAGKFPVNIARLSAMRFPRIRATNQEFMTRDLLGRFRCCPHALSIWVKSPVRAKIN